MLTPQDIEELYQWSHEEDGNRVIRERHRQIIACLVEENLILKSALILSETQREHLQEIIDQSRKDREDMI